MITTYVHWSLKEHSNWKTKKKLSENKENLRGLLKAFRTW